MQKKNNRYMVLGLGMLFAACGHSPSGVADLLLPDTPDSLVTATRRPYTQSCNFEVTADTLFLQQLPLKDRLAVHRGERLVVAELMAMPTDPADTVWVKVARDQETMGWIPEKDLLCNVVPVDPVSRFIHFFSRAHTVLFLMVLGFLGLGYLAQAVGRDRLRPMRFRDIDCTLPLLLTLLFSVAAVLYVSIRCLAPAQWEAFYYAPSLNPLSLPRLLGWFMGCVWLILVVGLATIDDVLHQTRPRTAFFFLLGLAVACIFLYLFFTYSTYYYIGYPCLLLYAGWTVKRLLHASRYRYSCGACGAKLRQKGICPHCGALNE